MADWQYVGNNPVENIPLNTDVWLFGVEVYVGMGFSDTWESIDYVVRASRSHVSDDWASDYHDEYGSRNIYRSPTHWAICETPAPPSKATD